MGNSFQRRVENFTCEHCAAQVVGNGYTNHCPHCLWSKHVDVNPGDRAAACLGMMKPIALQGSTPHYRILHRCERCEFERLNNVQAEDDAEALVALTQASAA